MGRTLRQLRTSAIVTPDSDKKSASAKHEQLV